LLFGELVYCVAGKRPTKAFKRRFSLTRAGKRWYPEVTSGTYASLNLIASTAADYPHIPVIVEDKEKKQTTRMLKIQCANHEKPIILRGSREAFENGLPTCTCGAAFQPVGFGTNEESN